MAHIVTILTTWQGIVLVIALVAIFVFRTPLAGLIQRTKSVGKKGLETYEPQLSKPEDEKKAIDEYLRTFDNPLILEAEELIQKDLKQRNIETPLDREKALLRSHAATNIVLQFERVHSHIWASQLTLLRFLNTREEGANITELVVYYENGKKEFPMWYENYQLERWLGFLQSFNLITKYDSHINISDRGREFLKYIVASGRPDPFNG